MNELDTRAERFLESIRAEGEAACAAIREETERAINTQLDETRRTENARVERTLRFETERAKTRANRDLSAARMAARATLAAQRQKIADETFSKAREQLAAFVAGKDYAAWLQKEAASLAETLGENAKITARAADLPLLKNVDTARRHRSGGRRQHHAGRPEGRKPREGRGCRRYAGGPSGGPARLVPGKRRSGN